MKKSNVFLFVLFVALVIADLMLPSLYVHEGFHWMVASVNPWEKPVGFHVLDSYCLKKGYYGCVTVVERYPGGFVDQPGYLKGLEECFALVVQYLFIFLVSLFFIINGLWLFDVKRRVRIKSKDDLLELADRLGLKVGIVKVRGENKLKR